MAAEPARYEVHYQDETHVDTNPHLVRVWQRKGEQVRVPAAGTNRRLTVFGSVIAGGQGRVEVLTADSCSTGFVSYLQALDQRHTESGREIFLVLDNGSAHTSQTSRAAMNERADWLHVVWLARYSPGLNPKEREWRLLKRDARGHLARDLRSFADAVLEGLRRLGGASCLIRDQVPEWFLAGHRKPPTGRKAGRPKGAKDSYKRTRRRKNLPTHT